MGLSNFSSAPEGVLPILIMNTVLAVALLKNMVRSVLQVMGAVGFSSSSSSNVDDESVDDNAIRRERRVSTSQFKSLCNGSTSSSSCLATMECCVCLNRFQADEEVSELSCKHFFHKGCLDKWFHNYRHGTCPLCRSVL